MIERVCGLLHKFTPKSRMQGITKPPKQTGGIDKSPGTSTRQYLRGKNSPETKQFQTAVVTGGSRSGYSVNKEAIRLLGDWSPEVTTV